MPFYLRLFGGARIESSGESLRGRAAQRRRLGLLALLAMAPVGSMSRDKVIGLLWPEHDAEGARKLLSEALYVLRKDLGEDVVTSIGDDLRYNRAVLGCDVLDFRAALSAGDDALAVESYLGPFLDGWFLSNASEFDRWMTVERDALTLQLSDALERLARHAESADDWKEAVSRRRAICATDPHSSRAAIQLARVLAASGERAEALKVLAAHETLLRVDFDAPPDAEVRKFASSLRGDSPAGPVVFVAPPSVSEVPVPAAGERSEPPALRVPPLPRSRRGLVATGVAVVVVFSIIAGTELLGLPARVARASTSPAAINQLGVTPFEAIGDDSGATVLAAGLTQQLLVSLGQIQAFDVFALDRVPARGTAQASWDQASPAAQAAIVRGSVQRSGQQVVVTMQLVDARTRAQIASKTIERPLSELIALERQIAEEVVVGLRRRLGQEARLREAATGTSNPEARELILRAESAADDAANASTAEGPEMRRAAYWRADSLFGRAHTADPSWAEPVLRRGWVLHTIAGLQSDGERVSTLRRALALNDEVPAKGRTEAHFLELRGALRWGVARLLLNDATDSIDLRHAAEDLERAVALDSTRATAWATLGNLYWRSGLSWARAAVALKHALRADPYLASAEQITFQIFLINVLRSEADTAGAWCRNGARLFPDNWHFVECELTLLKYSLSEKPDLARARLLLGQLDRMDPPLKMKGAGHDYAPLYRRVVLAELQARGGQRDAARHTLDSAYASTSTPGDSMVRRDMLPDAIYLHLLLGDQASAARQMVSLLRVRPGMRTFLQQEPLIGALARNVR